VFKNQYYFTPLHNNRRKMIRTVKNIFELNLIKLFEKWASEKVLDMDLMPESGSSRKYYRIKGLHKVAIGVYNKDSKENTAFIEFTKHFRSCKLNVPEILGTDLDNQIYLLEDLGNTTLFTLIEANHKKNSFGAELIRIYKKVIDTLPKFQIQAAKELNYTCCYPRANFDRQSMHWDLNYFKYYFLKLANVHFDEQKLEDDFQKLTDYLLQADCNYFLYRDFQSRNIMIVEGKPFFIDYQGGRKGALQYDIASLLYDAKANIPQAIRIELFNYYLSVLERHIDFDKQKFVDYYHGYVLIRIMQALGAYGFRGFYEKKEHFLLSVPYAIYNLEFILNTYKLPIEINTLLDVLQQIVEDDSLRKLGNPKNKVRISVNSFSYRRGIPSDEEGNGGGFVFDCRGIPNPGRFEEYKHLNGFDKEVIHFLEKEPSIHNFIHHAFELISASIKTYNERNYAHLMVNFGCTGGQHRSVFCANLMGKMLKENPNIEVSVRHREIEFKQSAV